MVEVLYSYSVCGQAYLGRQADAFLRWKHTLRWLNQYPKGKKVIVYYDPQKPERSVIEPRYRRTKNAVVSFLIFLVLVPVNFALLVALGSTESGLPAPTAESMMEEAQARIARLEAERAEELRQRVPEIKQMTQQLLNTLPHASPRQRTEAMELLEDTAQKFGEWLRYSPEDAEAHFLLGRILGELRQHEAAITEYRKALELNWNSSDARFYLGLALDRLGNLDAAIAEYRQTVGLDPKDVEAHYKLAAALERKGDRGAAIEHYRTAYRLDPRDPDIRIAYKRISGKARRLQ